MPKKLLHIWPVSRQEAHRAKLSFEEILALDTLHDVVKQFGDRGAYERVGLIVDESVSTVKSRVGCGRKKLLDYRLRE